jgi:predicted GNAT family N-acyltransferase
MVVIRPIGPDETAAAVALVREVFEEFVRPDLNDEGWAQLLEYVDEDAVRNRAENDHVIFVADLEGVIAGLIEVRMGKHISLLVVERSHFGKGIARRLIEKGIEYCRKTNAELEAVTVHSSRYAIDVYRRFGFEPVGEEMVVDGIRFTPMSVRVAGRS